MLHRFLLSYWGRGKRIEFFFLTRRKFVLRSIERDKRVPRIVNFNFSSDNGIASHALPKTMSIRRCLAPIDFINSKSPRFVQRRTNDGMRRWQRALSHGAGIVPLKIMEFLYCVRHRIEGSGFSSLPPPFSRAFPLFVPPSSPAPGTPSSCPPPSRTRRCRHRQMLLSRRAIINTEANVSLENAIVRLIQFARENGLRSFPKGVPRRGVLTTLFVVAWRCQNETLTRWCGHQPGWHASSFFDISGRTDDEI